MKELTIEVFGQEIEVNFNAVKDFFTAETMDEILFPEDLESGKAVEEIFLALQEALVEEYNLKEEDWVFFPEPPYSKRYFVTGVCKHQLPPEVLANPVRYWYDHTDDVWRTHY